MYSSSRFLWLAILLGVHLRTGNAQQTTCENYGIVNGAGQGICSCPSGLGSPTCSILACGNPLMTLSQRPLFMNTTAAGEVPSNGCPGTNQCTQGFTGPTCTVCQSDQACQTAASSDNASEGVTCNRGAWTWTEGFTSCSVLNPTLQAIYPGQTTLTIEKSPEPSLSLSSSSASSGSSSYGAGTNGTVSAQIWYAAPITTATGSATGTYLPIVEQFYCYADTCVQKNITDITVSGSMGAAAAGGGGSSANITVDYSCVNLRCTCRPGTTFCGGSGLDLTSTVNTLSGTIDITCSESGSTCSFKQSVLNTLFGQGGLSLSGCSYGECVKASTINTLAQQNALNPTDAGSGGNSLSGGVIAGLAVLGAILLGLFTLIAIGKVSQRRARNGRTIGHGGLLPLNESEKDWENKSVVGLRWNNLGYVLPPTSSPFWWKTSQKGSRKGMEQNEGKLILDGVQGTVKGGTFCGVLGPTGAGKSTLVDILAGRRKAGKVTGSVELISSGGNGSGESGSFGASKENGFGTPLEASVGTVKIGYVDQTDVLPSMSTVREALMFAAELKLGESISKANKRHRVEEVLEELGLMKIADSVIGSGERRGISGGERRRLSIGLELLAAPAILIADEPTSGLDSTSAKRVVQVLKALTNGPHRTTVIATIHQPSSQLFHLFDTILVLGLGGRQIYFGKAEEANAFFASKGYSCPDGWNPADHLLELASEPSADLLSSLRKTSSSNDHQGGTRYPLHSSDSEEQLRPCGRPKDGREHKPSTVLLTQFEVLAMRELKTLARDKSLLVAHLVVAIIIGLFVGGMYYQVNLTIGGFQSRVGSLFFLGALLTFSSLSALSNFASVRSLFLRERASSFFSPLAWALSRIVFDLIPLRIIPAIIVSTIMYWMVGLSGTAAAFFKYLLIVLEYNLAIALYNLFLAALIPEFGVAILISSVTALFGLAFAGFFVNLQSIPAVLRWIQWITPLKFMLEALAVNEVASGLMIKDTLQGVPIDVSAAVIMKTLFGFQTTAYYRDVLVLFAFIGGLGIAFCITVLFRLKELR